MPGTIVMCLVCSGESDAFTYVESDVTQTLCSKAAPRHQILAECVSFVLRCFVDKSLPIVLRLLVGAGAR